MKKIQAVFDSIIVKPLSQEEEFRGGIIMPNMGNDRNLKGTVISVGPGKYSVTGNFIETTIKEGDVVMLPSLGVTKVEFDDEEYYGLPESSVLAVLKDE